MLGTGLAGYDETQEGLAVLAEIAVGELTAPRVRQLAARVLAVDMLVGGDGFTEVFKSLPDAEFPPGVAYTTTMRVFRSGGLTKDAALRGEGEAIGLATVYRGLQWLEEAGIIHTIRTAYGEAAYRRCSVAHHHHLICHRCGKAHLSPSRLIGP